MDKNLVTGLNNKIWLPLPKPLAARFEEMSMESDSLPFLLGNVTIN